MAKDPKLPQASGATEVDAFLRKLAATAAPAPDAGGNGRGRLIFALDATASREPTWDRASHLQAEMFKETEASASARRAPGSPSRRSCCAS
jgi:hypothetical protein